jgi:hypothetical protein
LQGIQRRETRQLFWSQLWDLMQRKPESMVPYLTVCAHGEHFLEFREIVKTQIRSQLQQTLVPVAV